MHFHRLIVAAGLCALIAGAYAATTVGNLEPTTGTWRAYRGSDFTTLVCSNSSEAAMLACVAADSERRAVSTRYQLRYPNRYVRVSYSASPPPTSTDWTICANEYETCSFTGTRRVRFGLNTSWIERDLTASGGGVACRNSTFGSDPAVGLTKRCELRASTPTTEPAVPRACTSRVCDVSWTPNGPADGFRIFYSRIDGTWANPPVQVAGTVTRTNVTMPETGIFYFAVKAFVGANESPLSNVVVRDVQ